MTYTRVMLDVLVATGLAMAVLTIWLSALAATVIVITWARTKIQGR